MGRESATRCQCTRSVETAVGTLAAYLYSLAATLAPSWFVVADTVAHAHAGRPMPGFITVDREGLDADAALSDWAGLASAYVGDARAETGRGTQSSRCFRSSWLAQLIRDGDRRRKCRQSPVP